MYIKCIDGMHKMYIDRNAPHSRMHSSRPAMFHVEHHHLCEPNEPAPRCTPLDATSCVRRITCILDYALTIPKSLHANELSNTPE